MKRQRVVLVLTFSLSIMADNKLEKPEFGDKKENNENNTMEVEEKLCRVSWQVRV